MSYIFHVEITWYEEQNRTVKHACFVVAGSGASTLFIHFQVCCRAPLGWLWQGPPNVRRWPMLRSQAARPECVWPGWKVPFRPSAASLPLLSSATESHSEGREEEEEEEEEGQKKSSSVQLKYEHCCANHQLGCVCVTHKISTKLYINTSELSVTEALLINI